MSSKGIVGFNAGLVRSVGNGYTPTEWATGDVITANKLNHMEGGIADAGGELLVPEFTSDGNTYTCNVSYSDIQTAFNNNTLANYAIVRYTDSIAVYSLNGVTLTSSPKRFFWNYMYFLVGLQGATGIVEENITINENDSIEFSTATGNFVTT